ncbi:caspase family protein [Candidatus Pelagibacter sp.]|nr:caspase family protein [Candidatus Pelagibacter sp.]
MKRLLAYLFIVLGLGLTFSVNAKAIAFCIDDKNQKKGNYEWVTGVVSNVTIDKDDDCFISSYSQNRQWIKISQNQYIKEYLKKEKNNKNKTAVSNHLNGLYAQFKQYNQLNPKDIDLTIINDKDFSNYFKHLKYSKTQIAKQEPSQTQKFNNSDLYLLKPNTWVYFITLENSPSFISRPSKFDASYFLNNKINMKNYYFDSNEKLFKFKRPKGGVQIEYIRISKRLNDYWVKNVKTYRDSITIRQKIINNFPKVLEELIDEYTDNKNFKNNLLANFDEEPTIKPKKKVKVAKVEEPKQEEFKPKKTNQDNEAPVIQIAEAITVNDTDYEFQGKVTDQAKTIYVEVDGRPTDVKNGKFTVKGYSPIDKQISIEAIDQWGNRSEPKIVKLTIDIKDTSIAEKLEPLNPSKIRSKSSNNKVALIIGIENYLESPNAKYANLDAKYFFDYARKGFGVKKQNINLLVDEQATFVKTNKALTKWLRSKIKSGQSDLIIFFAGHGLASSDGKELYLLPQDSDPDLLARTALSRTELFQEIINLNPKSVTMFLDTCYSGVSRDEQMLLASARPIRIVADEQSEIPNNFTIFSASKLDQISSGLKEANHGIFSYYLMKGLEGNADSNEDKKITNGELLAYMDLNVSQKASELGRQQNPSLSGDPDKVLMSYR